MVLIIVTNDCISNFKIVRKDTVLVKIVLYDMVDIYVEVEDIIVVEIKVLIINQVQKEISIFCLGEMDLIISIKNVEQDFQKLDDYSMKEVENITKDNFQDEDKIIQIILLKIILIKNKKNKNINYDLVDNKRIIYIFI